MIFQVVRDDGSGGGRGGLVRGHGGRPATCHNVTSQVLRPTPGTCTAGYGESGCHMGAGGMRQHTAAVQASAVSHSCAGGRIATNNRQQ